MSLIDRYLNNNIIYKPWINSKADPDLELVVVIPCYNEEFVLDTLMSLDSCTSPNCGVEVIVVINSGENTALDIVGYNKKTLDDIECYSALAKQIKIHTIYLEDIRHKWSGVGFARKVGMDEAIRRLHSVSALERGAIISLDADCRVSKNYFTEIKRSLDKDLKAHFYTLNYSHPYDNLSSNNILRSAIVWYESYMRFYQLALFYSGFPHTFHSLGSTFVVRALSYVKMGGMNRRKAGEDFYFLHKLTALGARGVISTATVYPGVRVSDRVPFGTGPMLRKWIDTRGSEMECYNFSVFEDLKQFLEGKKKFYDLYEDEWSSIIETFPESIKMYLATIDFKKSLIEIRRNCSTYSIFEKRFFLYVNGFWVLKYLNFAHENCYKKCSLEKSIEHLFHRLGAEFNVNNFEINLLNLRILEKKNNLY